jgi:lysine 2,3-aminomutase
MPNYVLSQSLDHVVVRNYEGFITAYAQPEVYVRHDPSTCPSCLSRRLDSGEEGKQGVAALLSGEQPCIVPRGFSEAHERSVTPACVSVGPIPAGGNGHSH